VPSDRREGREPVSGAEDAAQQRWAEVLRVQRLHLAHELAAAFGHELSQPLAALVAFADVAVQRRLHAGAAPHGDEVVEFQEIAAQARRAAATLAELRRFASKGGREPARRCDLNALVRSACGLWRADAQARGVAIECETGAVVVPVLAEAARLEHALANLVANAVDAAAVQRGDGAVGVVRIVVQPAVSIARVSVLDNGAGLAPDQLDQVFKAFYTTKPEGLGLGLRIARSVVEAHRGRLWAEACPYGGAFHVTLPMLGPGDAPASVAP